MSILGPAVGYVLGGQLLTLYIDVDLKHRQGDIYVSFIQIYIIILIMLVPQTEHSYSISSDYHEGFFWKKN